MGFRGRSAAIERGPKQGQRRLDRVVFNEALGRIVLRRRRRSSARSHASRPRRHVCGIGGGRMSDQATTGRMVVRVPIEIWTCTLAVRTENYDAPVEAFLTRCALEAGDFRALREAFGVTLPVATLARL